MTARWIVTLTDGWRTRTMVLPGAEPPDATRAAMATIPPIKRRGWMVLTFQDFSNA
jgi:hypothetical protein